MTIRGIGTLATLLFFLAAIGCGTSTYYKVVEKGTGNTYYSKDLKWKANGAVVFTAARTDNKLKLSQADVHNITREEFDAALSNVAVVASAGALPVCSGQDAALCSSCWANPANTWCCTKLQPGKSTPDCGSTDAQCKYTQCNGSCDTTRCTKPGKNDGGETNIRITNKTSKDVTIAFITGAEGKSGSLSACTDAATMVSYVDIHKANPWCKNPKAIGKGKNAGYCTGTVKAHSSLDVVRPDKGKTGKAIKCLTGAVMPGGHGGCPSKAFPNGQNQFEFTLNPTDTDAEGTDISNVNGVAYALSISIPGEAWVVQDGGGAISGTVGPNGPKGGNIGKKGVFPVDCTDCIQNVGGSVCSGYPSNPTCQGSRICNIQRSGVTGGTLEFIIEDLK